MFFVTNGLVTYLLTYPFSGHFYLFFIRWDNFFITVLWGLVRMRLIRGDMDKPNLHPPQAYQTENESIVSTFPPVPINTTLETEPRLIVLLPSDIDYSAMTRQIWELAHTSGRQVQLLGLCEDRTKEPALRRALIGMASLLEDSKICAEAKVEIGTNWMAVVKANYKPADAIVCFAEQRTGLLNRPLSQVLESNFKATVYILSGPALQKAKSSALSQISGWLGFIGIIIAFGILQANIVQLPKGWLQNIMLIISIVPEFWLIWLWNGRFG
jgi:hypothetical protein